jgi:hypothetical protein
VYVGKKVTVTQRAEDLRVFRCRCCGTEATAYVVGVGQGQGNSAYFLDNDGAAVRADRHAVEAAARNVELTLSLARCPSCGQRSPQAVWGFWARYAFAVAAGVGLLWALGGILYSLEGSASALWIFGPLGPLTGAAIAWMEAWKWTTVDQRVAFLDAWRQVDGGQTTPPLTDPTSSAGC